jgi:uncharacterized protein DUF3108
MTKETGFGAVRRDQTRFLHPLVTYLAAAVVTTWPLVIHPRSILGATTGPGDPYLNVWILGWGMQSVLSNPASLFNGSVFNANIFYPATGTLTYSDHLLLQSVVLAPLYALTHDVVLCYNALLLASLVASALAMHLLVRSVVGSEHGAYLAGLAWGFGSYHFAHLIHLQLQALYFLPLTFLLLHRVIAGRQWRDVVLLGVMAALQAISSVYYGIIGGLALVVGGLALAVGVGRWRNAAVLRRLYYAAAIATVLVMPVAIIYGRVAQREGFGRNLYQAERNAASVSSYFEAPAGNVLYGRTRLLRRPDSGPERELFPGFVLIALALLGAWRGWKGDARPTVLAMAAVIGFGFVFSLGPDGARALYAAFHRFIFGFSAVRAPARFSVLVMFGLCVLAALGIRGLPRRFVLLVLAAAAIEWLHVPPTLAAAPSLHTDVGQWLAREPGSGAVAVLPLGLDTDATPAMVQSLEHRRPIVNGYSGQRPDFYRPLAETINTFPSRDALAALHDARVRFVVTPEPIEPAEPAEPAEPYRVRATFPGATIYELAWTPELETRLAATAAVEPPAPGVIPFQVGELAQYRVDWGGGGVNLSAGDISVAVDAPVYRFVLRATTAPWVAKFYEAQDVFTTQANTNLYPQVHEREQHEGSRNTTRAFIFDDGAHVVRTGRTVAEARADGAVTLPMSPQGRDAIAALFYIRTLPLAPGTRVKFPVNEAGRNLVVELVVEGIERIYAEGHNVDALRITPTIQRRVQDRQPFVSTLWLSNDARRVPLILDLDAGFGHVRVELVSYRR